MKRIEFSTQDSMSDFTILGASGFIGSNLISNLRKSGYSVSTPNRITLNITNVRHGHVIYCIGLTSDFRKRPLDTVQAHVCILRELLEYGEFDSLTYLSSTRVYHGSSSTTESSPLIVNPSNLEDLYAISKIAGESLCYHSGRRNVKVIRLSNIIGIREDNNLFINELLDEIITQKSLTLRSSLLSNKDYLFVDDAVSAIITLAVSKETGCFNVASGTNISNQVIIEELKSNFNFNLTVLDNAPILEFMPINIEKIKNIIQFETTDFTDYFPKLINFYKKRKKANELS
jgi:nucleoside-diphosphate-sugar epimerase